MSQTQSQPELSYVRNLNLEDFTQQSQQSIKDYICPLCKGIYLNPIIDSCGHIFCESCFLCFDSSLAKCPITNDPLPSRPTKVGVIVTIIEKQIMYCSNKAKGCEWEGQVKEYYSHIANDCLKQLIKCSMEGCNAEVSREVLKTHLADCEYRRVECEFCGITFPFAELDGHYQVCTKYLLECPQKCAAKIRREALMNHIADDCDFTKVNCTFHSIGCDSTVLKKDLDMHKKESFNAHLDLIFLSIYKQNIEVGDKYKAIENRLISLTTPHKMRCLDKEEPHSISNKEEISYIGAKRERDREIEVEKDKDGLQATNQINHTHNSIDDREISKKYKEEEHDGKQNEAQTVNSTSVPIVSKLNPSFEPTSNTIFDILHQPPGVTFKGNKAKNIAFKPGHKFVFINSPFDLNKGMCHWKIKILSSSTWIGLGVCDKKQVIANEFNFFSKKPAFKHGAFLISTNGYIWNSNVTKENSTTIQLPPAAPGDIIDFLYEPLKKELTFQLNSFLHKLTNVEGPELACCIIFLNYGNEVEVLFD